MGFGVTASAVRRRAVAALAEPCFGLEMTVKPHLLSQTLQNSQLSPLLISKNRFVDPRTRKTNPYLAFG